MQKKTTEIYNFSNTIIREVFDASSTLSYLISFLQKNDEKFKDFSLVALISLSKDLSYEERNFFYNILNECKNLATMPNIENFQKILIEKGANYKKFTIGIIENLLKAVTFEHKISSPLGLIAYKIYTKDKE